MDNESESISVYDRVKELIDRADKIALQHGIIIGRVSRHSPSTINEEGGTVVFEIDPIIYFKDYSSISESGGYLAVVDIKTSEIISLRIIEVKRQDILSELDLPEFTIKAPVRDATGLLTRAIVKAKPLLAYNPFTGVVEAANYVIEPQSPIIKPVKMDTVQKILGLPTKGVFIGYATIGERLLLGEPIPVYLPLKTFYQHILVLGTTGSGKTTLLKNMILSLYNKIDYEEDKPTIIIMDPNKDYVHIPLKPIWKPIEGVDWSLEKKLIEFITKRKISIDGLIIILPITQYIIDRLITEEETTWVKTLRVIAQDYFSTVYEGIIHKIGGSIKEYDIEIVEIDKNRKLRYAVINSVIKYNGLEQHIKLYIIPYGFRFTNMSPREFISLNPYFTQQARDALYRLLIKLNKEGITFNTLREFYNALIEARIQSKRKERERVSLDPRVNKLSDLIHKFALHKATLENIIRQIGSLVDTGFFDIMLPSTSSTEKYLTEPPFSIILEEHERLFNMYPMVIDLEYLQENSPGDPEQTIAIAAFRILNKVFEWKLIKARLKERTQPVIIFIDEAHRFFPSHGGRRDEYIEHISSMIDRIARLGRARGLGLVFSTHSPKDVHDIILQLANTKIILRMDKSLINYLDIPKEYRDFIIRVGDRVGIIKSHALRLGYVTFRTPLPLIGHFDLSALLGG